MSGLGELEHLIDAVEGDSAEVIAAPSRVALFGGTIQSNEEFDAGIKPRSRRDAFLHWVRHNRPELWKSLLVPEFFDDWNHFDKYEDLLKFEADLAYLTSAVLIFLEGPGAIAELGAFSQIESLRDRLVVVVADEHHEIRSFISLGPLRQLDLRKDDHVCVIPSRPPEELVQDIDLIERVLTARTKANRVKGKFNPRSRPHQFALVLDLITIAEVAAFTDLKNALPHFAVTMDDGDLHQLLFTLRKADLIVIRRYGGTYYYLPMLRREKWLDYAGVSEPFNRSRVAAKMYVSRAPNGDRARVHNLVYVKEGR